MSVVQAIISFKQPELPCQAVLLTVSLPNCPQASTWITTRTKVRADGGITASFTVCSANCCKKNSKNVLKNKTFSTNGRTGCFDSIMGRKKKKKMKSCFQVLLLNLHKTL